MLPQEILEVRCSEIVSEAVLGQKQSHSSSISCVAHRNFWLSMYVFAKPVEIEFPQEKVLRLVE